MATPSKTPRKTPHKERNILLQDDEKLLDEEIEEEKKSVSKKSRRKPEIVTRNVSEDIVFVSSDESESKLKKTPRKKKSKPSPTSSTKSAVSCVEDVSSTFKSAVDVPSDIDFSLNSVISCVEDASTYTSPGEITDIDFISNSVVSSEEDSDFFKLNVTPKKPSPKKLRPKTPSSKALENIAAESSPSGDVIESRTRRSGRVRSPTKRFIEKECTTPSKKPVLDDLTETEFDSDSTDRERPTTLFGNGDVEGQSLFGFKTPKKRNGMLAMAAKTPKSAGNSVGNPKTPKSARNSVLNPKTPHHLRVKTKKQLIKAQQESESGTDFSADESDDYQPNSNSSESEDEEATQEESPPEERRPVVLPQISSIRSTRNRKKEDYVPQSDDYFSSHTNKLPTSNHTLDRLKNPRLQQDQLFSLLKDLKLPAEHEKSIKELHSEYQSWYPKWITILREGFNILLYGLGSKRNLLQHFHSTVLRNENVLVVNGFFPSLTIKDILDDISEILELGSSRTDLLDLIEEKMLESSDECHLFILIHNLDGIMLRNNKAQTVLSRLAKFHKIHLICSIDHINTPLLWGQAKLVNFNFSWWDVTTLLPYSDETAFENSLLVQNSGNLALSSMKSVFQSLTKNTKGVYMLIVKQQMANKGQANYQGMLFKDLYTKSRESFLCSSDLALRAQLTEFLDHKLVKTKRGADGSEYLNIPLQYGLLQQFVEQQEAS